LRLGQSWILSERLPASDSAFTVLVHQDADQRVVGAFVFVGRGKVTHLPDAVAAEERQIRFADPHVQIVEPAGRGFEGVQLEQPGGAGGGSPDSRHEPGGVQIDRIHFRHQFAVGFRGLLRGLPFRIGHEILP